MITEKLSKKKAISPILATVILIAITLIAAVAIAGFVFGLFGSFTSTAQISVSASNCSISQHHCIVSFINTGTGTGSVNDVSISYGGLGYVSLACPIPSGPITPGGGSIQMTCPYTFPGASVNEAYTLEVTASSGGQPLGAGSFSG